MSENGSENGSEARSVSDNGQSIGLDSASASSGTPSTVDELKTRAQAAADAVDASTGEFEKSLNLYYNALNSFSNVLYSGELNSSGRRVMNTFIFDDSGESVVKQLKEYHQNLIDWHKILKTDYDKFLKKTKGGSSRRRSIKFGKSKRKRPRKSSRRRKGRNTRRNRR
jgi:hypothetical protein